MRTTLNDTPVQIKICANKQELDPQTGKYKDPLMRWPIRGAAFTNEVGEALRPLIGEYATLSWAPALLYIGADVYDKYKNDKTEYNPNSKRGLKQAIFQGLASVLLPLVAVKAGQNSFSLFGLIKKDKITINTKEHINQLAQNFVKNGKMRKFKDNEAEAIKEFKEIVSDNLHYKRQEELTNNPLKKLWLYTQDKITSALKINTEERIDDFATRTIKRLFRLRKSALNPDENFIHTPEYEVFSKAMAKGQTTNVATKTMLIHHLEKCTLKGKAIKTLGGFIALGCAIKPIDKFVENVLIEKYIKPTLSSNFFKNQSK